MNRTFVVEDAEGWRVDKYIADHLGLFKRSQIKNRNVVVKINGTESKMSRKVTAGDVLELSYTEPEPVNVQPERIPLDIIFENRDVIVINKVQGVVVHPAPGNYHDTLVQGLMYYLNGLSENFPDEKLRPGVVHRLDKETSGVIIAAKNPKALEFLANQFRDKTTEKRYLAFVKGNLKLNRGKIDTFITRDRKNRKKFTVSGSSGKHAVTEYELIKKTDKTSFVMLAPRTGRTHQLRVHMLSLGNPIVGDPVYGRPAKLFSGYSLMLHAAKLKIRLPGEAEPRIFYAPVPDRFRKFYREYFESEELESTGFQEYL